MFVNKVFYHYRRYPGTRNTQAPRKDLHLRLNMIPLVCGTWGKKNVITGNETFLLSRLLGQTWNAFCTLKAQGKNYAKQILDSFGPDIYNPETVKKCNKLTQSRIHELEDAAAHPEKYQDKPARKKYQYRRRSGLHRINQFRKSRSALKRTRTALRKPVPQKGNVA